MYYEVLIKILYIYIYIYIIVKIPGQLVFSVNNRYTGLIRTNIRYGKNEAGGGNIFLIKGVYFLSMGQ